MRTNFSKAYGPTDSAAATKTAIGTAASLRPEACTIKTIRIAKGNVTNAKECAGFITIDAPGLEGPHHYAYGNGVGGATDSQNIAAEEINCSIPIAPGAIITASITDGENAKDCIISLGFDKGRGRNAFSYVVGGPAIDPSADTLEPLVDYLTGVAVKMGKPGNIREIRVAGSGVTAAKANSSKLEILPPVIKGPWEYAIGNGPGGAATGGPSHADVIECNIPVKAGEVIVINATTTEDQLTYTVSFQVV